MISLDMKTYDYLTFGEEDGYGQAQLDDTVQGTIKMAIYTTSQNIQDNINYQDASYIGLTTATITDKQVIKYGKERLKVLYVQPKGRFKQVFMKSI